MYQRPNYRDHWQYPMGYYRNYTWSYNPNPYFYIYNWNNRNVNSHGYLELKDYGPRPLVIDIEQAAEQNNNYRTALWTGKYFQVTLMSIPAGGDIGLEVHPATDQFIRIEEGQGLVQMGPSKENLNVQQMAYDGYAIMVPAGTWHNITNTGHRPLKVYVIYAPPHHPHGTVQATKAIAQEEAEAYSR